MGKYIIKLASLLLAAVLLAGCAAGSESTQSPAVPTAAHITEPKEPTSVPTTGYTPEFQTEPSVPGITAAPAHAPLFIPGLDVADVIRYFNEVTLDAEFVNSGDARLLQKWTVPICYTVAGDPTGEDLTVLENFCIWLNTLEGFPGIAEAGESDMPNLQIYFCSQQEMLERMGENFTGMDGAVTFWYYENEIYDAIICIRTDLDQQTRNSVILEELYNGLGPIQDTSLRPESIIYAEFSTPQALDEIDELILKLLYHPRMICGWDAPACEAMIRELYY